MKIWLLESIDSVYEKRNSLKSFQIFIRTKNDITNHKKFALSDGLAFLKLPSLLTNAQGCRILDKYCVRDRLQLCMN